MVDKPVEIPVHVYKKKCRGIIKLFCMYNTWQILCQLESINLRHKGIVYKYFFFHMARVNSMHALISSNEAAKMF